MEITQVNFGPLVGIYIDGIFYFNFVQGEEIDLEILFNELLNYGEPISDYNQREGCPEWFLDISYEYPENIEDIVFLD